MMAGNVNNGRILWLRSSSSSSEGNETLLEIYNKTLYLHSIKATILIIKKINKQQTKGFDGFQVYS